MYSGEYDVCDVTLSECIYIYPHRASLKNMPGHGENRTAAMTFGILAQCLPTERSTRSDRFKYVT
jgi:hypothetical protein